MIRIILTTFASESDGVGIVRQLVEERLVACGTILPRVRSIYRWQGAIEDSTEIQVLLKTSLAKAAEAQQRLLALHPYEVPECILLAPEQVSAKYQAWLLAECEDSD